MDGLETALKKYRGKRVLVTGHTGFKGSWLSFWLKNLGAEVFGYALAPESPSHFLDLGLEKHMSHEVGDIRDFEKLNARFAQVKPDIVFHLAAQPIVRLSYEAPLETFSTNVQGSAHVLEAARRSESVRSLVYVTSDKCYRNHEWVWGYRETDELGGHDPYSASKAAAEIVFQSFFDSYFAAKPGVGVATVRAGNVIGGGDWARDRIVPDCFRALSKNQPIILRRPRSTRPWQHVLEPLSGYLQVGAALLDEPKKYSGAWNFGPDFGEVRTVLELTQNIVSNWGSGEVRVEDDGNHVHEAGLLALNCDKAKQILKWAPRWKFADAARETTHWYKQVLAGESASHIVEQQIKRFVEGKKHD